MRQVVRVVAAALVGVALLAVVLVVQPPRLDDRQDASDLEPGLLKVAGAAGGAVSLGHGVYVAFHPSGLQVSRQGAGVWRAVDHGASFTAGLGDLHWRSAPEQSGYTGADGPAWKVRESVRHSLGNLTITGRTLDQNRVRYVGRVYADAFDGPLSREITITVSRRPRDSRVLLDVQVPGADAVAMHSFRRSMYVYRGGGAQHGELLLSNGRYPMVTRATDVGGDKGASLAPVPVVFSSDSTGFALDTRAYSVLDLRHDGRLDATVWGSRLQARLYDGTPAQVVSQHASDAGLIRALPQWATHGAVVAVRGSPARVDEAVTRLRDANAALAAVLVADGGHRRRYPRWDRLLDRLAVQDVRVLTGVSASLALRPRASGPDDEARLLTVARNRGYLVRDRRGGLLPVRAADPDRGSVPAALIDLTNPDAVQWYTQVLAERMRSERLSGWQVLGGDELGPDALLAQGDTVTEHNAWPGRWAAIPRAACVVAGRSDCLLLQATADEGSATSVGAFGLGQQATDWTSRGLGGVVAATVNAGISGLSVTYSAVGGSTTLRSWSGRSRGRTDELLHRWTELETFGPLLVTTDGDHPERMVQVWDSPDRVEAFARMTRVYAALADYRRVAMRRATQSGLPVVRPVWMADPSLRQDVTGSTFLFGDSLVVVPVLEPGQRMVEAHLPPGRWVELFTGIEHIVGPPSPPSTLDAAFPTDVATPQRVTVAAPPGRPVVLYPAEDREGRRVRSALENAGLLP